MRVMILTISAGQGHNQAANAISDCLLKHGIECCIVDAYRSINPILSLGVSKGYLIGTQYAPGVYGGFYRMAEKRNIENKNLLASFANSILGRKLLKGILQYRPDFIISTHLFAGTILTQFKEQLDGIRTIGIVTDFTVHPFWEETRLDYYVTASHLLNNQLRKKGIDEKKVLPFGIPINSKFGRKVTKDEAKDMLNILSKPVILLVMGSMGYGNVKQIVRKIDSLQFDFQLLVVCGRNSRARRSIAETNFKHRVYNYGFVDNIDVMMDAAEFIVTKPGGLTVSESLAKGLPLIMVNPIPGQEDRNAEFLLNNGLGMYVTSTFPIDEAIYQLFNNEFRRTRFEETVGQFGHPDAAVELCEFIKGKKLMEEY